MISIMIVDDHPMIREGLADMFTARKRFVVRCIAPNGEAALRMCREKGIADVVLSDVAMPRMDGFTFLEKARAAFPDIKVLLLAGMPRTEEEKRARDLGAKGYVSKSLGTSSLADAVAGIAVGALEFVTDSYEPVKSPFSEKEKETLKYLAYGKTREEIAIIMGCGAETIKSRIMEIRRKVDAPNATAAVFRAIELGYVRI